MNALKIVKDCAVTTNGANVIQLKAGDTFIAKTRIEFETSARLLREGLAVDEAASQLNKQTKVTRASKTK